jgi:flagellar basal body rod protein FlgG
MLSAIASALNGLATEQRHLDRSARRIARAGLPPATDSCDLPQAMIQLMVARRGFEANLRSIEVADRMQGSLLDILA